jgi:hypothetical protein
VLVNRRNVVWCYVFVVVVEHAVSFGLLLFKVNIFDVHSCVIVELSKRYFSEFLSKKFFFFVVHTVVKQILHCILAPNLLG